MSATSASSSIVNRNAVSRLVRAGLVTGVVDGLFSSVLSVVFYGSTVTRLFQGVASTLLGREALDELLGHFPFVGIPIVASLNKVSARFED